MRGSTKIGVGHLPLREKMLVRAQPPAPLLGFTWHCFSYVILAVAAISLISCGPHPVPASVGKDLEPFDYVDPYLVDDLVYRGPVFRPIFEFRC